MSRLALFCLALSCFAVAPPPAFAHNPAAEEMATAADRFLDSLSDAEKQRATFKLDDAEREDWHFVPDFAIQARDESDAAGRRGLSLKEMTSVQKRLALALLNSALSHKGQLKAASVMMLEKVLREIEGKDFRDPDLYYVSIFGEPDAHGTWGFRFEGHHLSVNLTIVGGERFSVTPSFFGSNPAEVPAGPFKGEEVLAAEEDLGLKLMNALSADERKSARLPVPEGAERAGKDLVLEVLTHEKRVAKPGLVPATGVRYADLDEQKQQIFRELVDAYVGRFRREVLAGTPGVESSEGVSDAMLADAVFGWVGAVDEAKSHYYRVRTPKFVLEFANSQNGANHVHAVWRDFENDFGRDILGEHYRNDHAAAGEWIDLFDGESLAGWTANFDADAFTVSGGVLRTKTTQPERSAHLFYTGDDDADDRFENFEVELEARGEPGSNSGLFFHTGRPTFRAKHWLSQGYEVQLDARPDPRRKTGSLYLIDDLTEESADFDPTEWFTIRLRVDGRRISIWRNGRQVVDYLQPESPEREAGREGRVLAEGGGAIAIQAHDPEAAFEFRKIRLRRLGE